MKIFTKTPGKPGIKITKTNITVSNGVLSAQWELKNGSILPSVFENKMTGTSVNMGKELFSIVPVKGSAVGSADMIIKRRPRKILFKGEKNASRMGKRIPLSGVTAVFSHKKTGLEVEWTVSLGMDANYFQQSALIRSRKKSFPLKKIVMMNAVIKGAEMSGKIQGLPIVTKDMFFGVEYPMCESVVNTGRVRCSLLREMPLKKNDEYRCSFVAGVCRKGQLRRGFMHYLERERAHPYRTFLHYNSWYDIGYFSKYSEADCLDVLESYGRELVKKRNTKLDSCLFDDGWDEPRTLWAFHKGFLKGFKPVSERCGKFGHDMGVWLSPWGGYGNPRIQRVKFGTEQGYEIYKGRKKYDNVFKLSGPKYYKRFREICLEMIRRYGVNQFKFDGLGTATSEGAGSFTKDFEAMMALIHELRSERRDLYVNLTTGTWASPFWLIYADSIWRGWGDHGFKGVGSKRQQWITYRDSAVYANVVSLSSLYPLSALMLHGIIYARHAGGLESDPCDDLRDEIRSGLGSGTQLQELYITPGLMSKRNWDDLAEAAKWARKKSRAMADVHWVGGNPEKLKVYGWAGWTGNSGFLVLRNPHKKVQNVTIDPIKVFELPSEYKGRKMALKCPFSRQRVKNITVQAGKKHRIKLRPFEVLVFNAR